MRHVHVDALLLQVQKVRIVLPHNIFRIAHSTASMTTHLQLHCFSKNLESLNIHVLAQRSTLAPELHARRVSVDNLASGFTGRTHCLENYSLENHDTYQQPQGVRDKCKANDEDNIRVHNM